jgi:uncharacterized protein
MKTKKIDNKIFVRLEIGDEVSASLKEACAEHGVRAGSVTGIGGVDKVELGFFEASTRDYRVEKFEEDFELLSLKGNVSEMDGEPYVHLHIMLGRGDYSMIGGHLVSAVISLTGEIVIDTADEVVERARDEKVGLNLWKV